MAGNYMKLVPIKRTHNLQKTKHNNNKYILYTYIVHEMHQVNFTDKQNIRNKRQIQQSHGRVEHNFSLFEIVLLPKQYQWY